MTSVAVENGQSEDALRDAGPAIPVRRLADVYAVTILVPAVATGAFAGGR